MRTISHAAVSRILLVTALVTTVLVPAVAQGDAAAGLPGGASSLTEAHGDWTVACQAAPAAGERPAQKACAVSQRQVSQQGQNVFAVELRPTADGGATGAMMLPFGVAVREEVVLKVDDAVLGEPLSFSTCLPAGCLVPLTLSAETVTTLKSGKAATVTAPAFESAPVELTLALTGLGNALARVAELGAQN